MAVIEGNHGERIHISTVYYDRVIPEQHVIDVVVNNAVLVLKHLIQCKPASPAEVSFSGSQLAIISRLARRIEDISHPRAKACVLWLVGQYSATEHAEDGQSGLSGAVDWAPDVLRRSAKSFRKEVLRFMFLLAEFSLTDTPPQATPVKLQILTLAAKLLVLCRDAEVIRLLSRYVFSLARYDVNYDVRDRARMLASLLGTIYQDIDSDVGREDRGGVVLRPEQVKLVLFEGKGAVASDFEDSGAFNSITSSPDYIYD